MLAQRLSNAIDAAFRVPALEEALARFGKPDIQTQTKTSYAFTSVLRNAQLSISLDGPGLVDG